MMYLIDLNTTYLPSSRPLSNNIPWKLHFILRSTESFAERAFQLLLEFGGPLDVLQTGHARRAHQQRMRVDLVAVRSIDVVYFQHLGDPLPQGGLVGRCLFVRYRVVRNGLR